MIRDRLELERLQDEFKLLQERTSEQLDSQAAAHRAEVDELRSQLDRAGRRLEEVVEEFRQSTSWRLTAPVRALGTVLKQVRSNEPVTEESEDAAVLSSAPAAELPAADQPATYPPSYFEDLYRQDPDPWDYATSWYERRKYAITVACLPKERYRRVFEPGCSIGVLSESLAQRCNALVATDCAPTAVEQARARLGGHAHVEVGSMQVPGEWPDGSFDLIVLCEFVFFLDHDDLETLIARTMESLSDDGHIIAVHYLPAGKIVHSADEVHDAFRRHPDLVGVATHRESEFLLDVFARTSH